MWRSKVSATRAAIRGSDRKSPATRVRPDSIDFGAVYFSNNVEPGVFYKVYLDDKLSDAITGVLGLQLNVLIN